MRLAIMLRPKEAKKWLIVDVIEAVTVEDEADLPEGVGGFVGVLDIGAVAAVGCDLDKPI